MDCKDIQNCVPCKNNCGFLASY